MATLEATGELVVGLDRVESRAREENESLTMPADYSFPKEYRLRKRHEFKRVERKRCRAYGDYVVVFAARNDLGHSRLGITVTKKVGNSPTRNWWKRRLREIFRLNQSTFTIPVDLVIIVRFEAAEKRPSFDELRTDTLNVIAKSTKKLIGDKS